MQAGNELGASREAATYSSPGCKPGDQVTLKPRARKGVCRKNRSSVPLCDLCVSVVNVFLNSFHHGDTEIFTEAQRRDLFRQTPKGRQRSPVISGTLFTNSRSPLPGSTIQRTITQGSQSLALGSTLTAATQLVANSFADWTDDLN